MKSPDTVTEAIDFLAERGYTENMQLIGGSIVWNDRCSTCGVDDVEVDMVLRFEGPSDPGDEMVVFALHDPASGAKGALASGYGPAADPELMDLLSGFETRHKRRDA